MSKFESTNKEINFQGWWDLVVEKYSLGCYNAPIIGFDPDAKYDYYIPKLEDVERFRNNVALKTQYEKLYNEGESIESALICMY